MNLKKLFSLITFILIAQYIISQELVTSFRTPEEKEADIWDNKIISEQEMEDYIFQLVASKAKDDYNIHWMYVQILDKTSRKLVQQLEIETYGIGESLEFGDFNFDGYTDFSLDSGYATLDNKINDSFLFDPKTKTFKDSSIWGSNLEFHEESKTITSSNRCCAGLSSMYETSRIVDDQMIVIEQHCYDVVQEYDEDGYQDVVLDEDGHLIFEEVDCNTYFIDIDLETISLKNNFKFRLGIYDENMAGAFIQYADSVEHIPFFRKESKSKTNLQYDRIVDSEVLESILIKLNAQHEVLDVIFIPRNSKKRIKTRILEKDEAVL